MKIYLIYSHLLIVCEKKNLYIKKNIHKNKKEKNKYRKT